MRTAQPAPLWLWRSAAWAFGAALLGVAGLAAALALGLADPPRAGPLVWSDDFQAGLGRWAFDGNPVGSLVPDPGGLLAEFSAPGQWAAALTPAPAGDFTLEAGGAQTAGEIGARYGLVFAWRDAADYAAALVNGNGYAEVFSFRAGERRVWFAFQQWPHILVGGEANRVRVDVRGPHVTVRVNDERVVEFDAPPTAGQVGVLAQSAGPGRVLFNWVRLWAD
jgi:hypothetical protein